MQPPVTGRLESEQSAGRDYYGDWVDNDIQTATTAAYKLYER